MDSYKYYACDYRECMPEHEIVVVSFAITTRCNFRCPFCFIPKEELAQQNLLPLSTVQECMEYLMEKYPGCLFDINLYGGELLLLQEDLKPYIDYLYNIEPLEELILITNATQPLPKFLRKHEDYSDPRFRIACSYYPWNKDFYKRYLEYSYYFKDKVTISCLPYKDTSIIEGLYSLVENKDKIGTMPYITKTEFNNISMLHKDHSAVTTKEFKQKTDSICHSYIVKPNYMLLGEENINQKFYSIQEIVEYRNNIINSVDKCSKCCIRGTCPTLPKCVEFMEEENYEHKE